LTGLPVSDPATLDYPAVNLMISNFPASARPQAGTSWAPHIFEIFISEGMTRWFAVFYGDFPRVEVPITGDCPIRSVPFVQTDLILGNFVWFDANEDGLQNIDEGPVAGVCVLLYDGETDQLLDITSTDSNGFYGFNVEAGRFYYTQFIPPPGMSFTAKDVGGDDFADSDADPANSLTPKIMLDENDFRWDVGFIPDSLAGEEDAGDAKGGDGHGEDLGLIEDEDEPPTDAWQAGVAGESTQQEFSSGDIEQINTDGHGDGEAGAAEGSTQPEYTYTYEIDPVAGTYEMVLDGSDVDLMDDGDESNSSTVPPYDPCEDGVVFSDRLQLVPGAQPCLDAAEGRMDKEEIPPDTGLPFDESQDGEAGSAEESTQQELSNEIIYNDLSGILVDIGEVDLAGTDDEFDFHSSTGPPNDVGEGGHGDGEAGIAGDSTQQEFIYTYEIDPVTGAIVMDSSDVGLAWIVDGDESNFGTVPPNDADGNGEGEAGAAGDSTQQEFSYVYDPVTGYIEMVPFGEVSGGMDDGGDLNSSTVRPDDAGEDVFWEGVAGEVGPQRGISWSLENMPTFIYGYYSDKIAFPTFLNFFPPDDVAIIFSIVTFTKEDGHGDGEAGAAGESTQQEDMPLAPDDSAENTWSDPGIEPLNHAREDDHGDGEISVGEDGGDPALTPIEIFPQNPTMNVGEELEFTAQGRDQDGNPIDINDSGNLPSNDASEGGHGDGEADAAGESTQGDISSSIEDLINIPHYWGIEDFNIVYDSGGEATGTSIETGIGPTRSGREPNKKLGDKYDKSCNVQNSKSAEVDAPACANVFASDENDINSAFLDIDRLIEIAKGLVDPNHKLNYSGNKFLNLPTSSGQYSGPPDPYMPAGKDAQTVLVFYNLYNQALWVFDPLSGGYLRFTDMADGSGEFYPASDRLNGRQLIFHNVIVMFTKHIVKSPTIIDIDIEYTQGRAILFRDGKAYPIYWRTYGGEYEKETGRQRPIKFVDADGNPIPLHPGQIWVHIVTTISEAWEIEPGHWKVRFYPPPGTQ